VKFRGLALDVLGAMGCFAAIRVIGGIAYPVYVPMPPANDLLRLRVEWAAYRLL
jgi:hypothetical protein